MAKAQKFYFLYKDQRIPCKVFFERRGNARCSFGKDSLIMRMPYGLSEKKKKEQLNSFSEWAKGQLDTKQGLKDRYLGTSYSDGDRLVLRGKEFIFNLKYENRLSSRGFVLDDQTIEIILPIGITPIQERKALRTLTSRVLASYFKEDVTKRTLQLNSEFFNEDIRDVRMKYNRSNWGSCSSNKNINLSTRLLFTPDEVFDYVIIHELAHLKEMNHSVAFWKWVTKACPDYKKHVKHLSDFGRQYDFK